MDIKSLMGVRPPNAVTSTDRSSNVRKSSETASTGATSATHTKLNVLELTASLAGREPDNSKRISELKQAIEQGTYKVDSNKIAESFLRDEMGI